MPTSLLLQTECLSDDVLKRYLGGLLPEDSATQVEQHLSQCTGCENLVERIDAQGSNDELLQPIRECSLPSFPSEPKDALVANRPWLPWVTSREVGPYDLIEPLGHGGMGLVYLARHRKLDRLVAIKLLPAHHQTADARVRFEREILAAGRLQHPSIVSATDAGQFDDMDYLVMEYVRGLDFGRLSKSISIFNFEEVAEIGRQIAIGLSYAHAQGFVHRDIKPSNIILDDTGVVKILDFGLVLFDRWDGVSNELTTVGQFLGTLDYMAPEQAERCGSVDFRADLYALGATLFKLLCGRAPLAAAPNQSPIDKLRLLATHRPPSLKILRPDAPEPLIRLVDSLLSTVPQSRPASAAHVAEDLQPLAKPGCLVDLIARARIAELDTGLLKALPVERKVQTRSMSTPPMIVQPASALSGNGNRWLFRWRAWVTAALVPLAFLAGYIIQLDTPDGQFIVESEVAGAQLKIVKAGAETKSLKIETGNSVTKLLAGKYEVTLDSPSDGVTIDRDWFVIERGAIVIARIRKAPSSLTVGNVLPPPETSAISKVADPMYDGKTLGEWLEIARREKEYKSWRVAMTAVNNLTDAGQKKDLFEEVFQLCLSKNNLSVCNSWGLAKLFANRIVQELEKADSKRRLELVDLASNALSEKDLDPIWKWLDGNLDRWQEQTEQLTRKVLGLNYPLGTQSNPEGRLVDIGSVVYLAKHFPRLATLFDDHLLNHWSSPDRNVKGSPFTELLFLHVRRIALQRLEIFDKGFAEHVAALAIILERENDKNDSFLELSSEQKELVCRRTVELIGSAWKNRETAYLADWKSNVSFNRLTIGSGNLKQKNLSVTRLLNILHCFLDKVQPDDSTRARILNALAMPEMESREDATTAIAELTKELPEVILANAFFGAQDFLLQEKVSYANNKIIYQVPSSFSPERRAKIDVWCFAYNVHRYVSFLLCDQNNSFEGLSPTDIGLWLSAFCMLDLNQDWSLEKDEWLPGLEMWRVTNSKAIRLSEFSKMLTSEELTKLLERSDSFSQLDLDKDNRLSAEEAIGFDDFSSADRNSDGFLNFAEYCRKGVLVIQANRPRQPGKEQELRAWYESKMKKSDTANKGFLTREEFGSNFESADQNKDGKIDLDEYIKSRTR